MTVLHWTPPSETEVGSAGEQPAKGYLGGAHRNDGQGARSARSSRPTLNHPIGSIDPSCLRKRTLQQAQTSVQETGGDTGFGVV